MKKDNGSYPQELSKAEFDALLKIAQTERSAWRRFVSAGGEWLHEDGLIVHRIILFVTSVVVPLAGLVFFLVEGRK